MKTRWLAMDIPHTRKRFERMWAIVGDTMWETHRVLKRKGAKRGRLTTMWSKVK